MLLNFNILLLQTGTSPIPTFALMIGLFVVMYFVMIRPQKKKQKQEQEMREAVQIGDEITTIGGIMGRVVTVKEDALIIETSADKSKMKISRWAIQTNNTSIERAEAEKAAAVAAQNAEREAAQQRAIDEGKKVKKKKKSKKSEDDD